MRTIVLARGAVVATVFLATQPARADLSVPARRALEQMDARAKGAELVAGETMRLRDGTSIVRFDQTWHGIPVTSRGAAVRLDDAGRASIAHAHLLSSPPATDVAAVDAARAAVIAARVTWLGADASTAKLVVFPLPAGARLAWRFTPRVPFGVPTAPEIIVDATDGRVLRARDRVVFANRASVFVDNPVRTPALGLQRLPIPTVDDTLRSDVIRSFNCVDQGKVQHVDFGGGASLDLHVCDPLESARANADGAFEAVPDDDAQDAAHLEDPFSEVSMYFHAARAYQYFRALRGDENAQIVQAHPLPTVSNLRVVDGLFDGTPAEGPAAPLLPFSNAFFTPGGDGFGSFYGIPGGAMFFGQGPRRDYAYDGDVVYHELTHGVVDRTIQLGEWHLDEQGLVDAPGAMNEGLADYFSSAIAGDPSVGEYAAADILDGDAPIIRSLANGDTCPAAILGEVHFDSTLFSGGLYAVRSSLPSARRQDFDAAVYEAMLTHPQDGDLGYEDFLQLVDETLALDMPDVRPAFEEQMAFRGLWPACSRVVPLLGDAVDAPVDALGPRGWIAPGSYLFGGEGLAPGVVQIEAHLDPSRPRIGVRFSAQESKKSAFTGGRGSPFTPKVVAKFDRPIRWSYESTLTHDGDAEVAAEPGSGDTYEADFDVPPGASRVYLQIVNAGEKDGLYDHVEVGEMSSRSKPPTQAADATPESGGCGCSLPGGSSLPGSAALALAGSLALLGRRRRRARDTDA